MAGVVLDASAVLALLRREPGGAEVESVVKGALISVVNWAEIISFFVRRGTSAEDAEEILQALSLHAVDATHAMATSVGALRDTTAQAGLSLGDRFCLALALERGLPAMTTDKAWSRVAEAVGVDVKLVR